MDTFGIHFGTSGKKKLNHVWQVVKAGCMKWPIPVSILMFKSSLILHYQGLHHIHLPLLHEALNRMRKLFAQHAVVFVRNRSCTWTFPFTLSFFRPSRGNHLSTGTPSLISESDSTTCPKKESERSLLEFFSIMRTDLCFALIGLQIVVSDRREASFAL